MDFTEEQKAQMEPMLKQAMKSMVEVMSMAGHFAAVNSSNKIDDVIEPAVNPIAKGALDKLIDGMKL